MKAPTSTRCARATPAARAGWQAHAPAPSRPHHPPALVSQSLLALANCINALARTGKPKRVKYRDSKLTLLLKSSLEGTCRVVMIAAVSPSFRSFEESHNTLKYASRAKNIKVKPVANVEVHDPSARRPASQSQAGSNTAARVAARAERAARREAGETSEPGGPRGRVAARSRGRRAASGRGEEEEEVADDGARPLTAHPPCPPGRGARSRNTHRQHRRVSVSVPNREHMWGGSTPGAEAAPRRPRSAPREAVSHLRPPTSRRGASPAVPESQPTVLAAATAYVSTPSSLRDSAAAAAAGSRPSSARSGAESASGSHRRGLPPMARAPAETQRTLEEEIELAWGDTEAPRPAEWRFGSDPVPFAVVESMHDRWTAQKARLLRSLSSARRNAEEAERDADAVRHRATQAEDRSNQASVREREASRRLAQLGTEQESAARRVGELEKQLEEAHQQLGEVEQSASQWRAAAERARARARRSAIGGSLSVEEEAGGARAQSAEQGGPGEGPAPTGDGEPEPAPDASPAKRRRVPGGAQAGGSEAPSSPLAAAPQTGGDGEALDDEWAALCGRSPTAAAERRASGADGGSGELEPAMEGSERGASAAEAQPRPRGSTPRPVGSGSRAAAALSNKSDRLQCAPTQEDGSGARHRRGAAAKALELSASENDAPARRRPEASAAAATAESGAEGEALEPVGGETIAQRVRRRRSMLQPPSTRAALAQGRGGGLPFEIYEGKPEPAAAACVGNAASARPASKSRRVLADSTNATPRASGIPVKRSLRRMSMAAPLPSKGARW